MWLLGCSVHDVVPRPSGKDSLVFNVRIFGICKPCDFGGQVGGASQTNGISRLIYYGDTVFPCHSSSQCALESSVTAINLLEDNVM